VTAFVVLAAGRGSRLGRIGDAIPKCLLPLNGRAVLSHQLELAPHDARKIVVTGYRSAQVREYLYLAHPGEDVTVIEETNWGRGPGASLLEARTVVGDDDLVFVACDTLWTQDDQLWRDPGSWVATASIPAGTPAARWCRIVVDGYAGFEYVAGINDKTPDIHPNSRCWTAFAKVARDDLRRFWSGLVDAPTRAGEIQLSSGLDAIINGGEPVSVHDIEWLDVGDERAFRQAAATLGGYDALKPDQITYVLPRRVVKFHTNRDKVEWRVTRSKLIGDAVPTTTDSFNGTMCAYDYVEGAPVYDELEYSVHSALVPLLDWWTEKFWSTRFTERAPNFIEASDRFYRDKTFERVSSLDPALRSIALDAITRVDWDDLVDGVVPGVFHGDFTFANVILQHEPEYRFKAIDWREDYAGVVDWGDLRYDLGKLLAGARFHWHRATHGDFRRWERGTEVELVLEREIQRRFPDVALDDVRRIAALCLINSSALHAAPMDEILIARGCHWLETLT
jgi:UTP-glucose-1-phosphate uridylyltransferase